MKGAGPGRPLIGQGTHQHIDYYIVHSLLINCTELFFFVRQSRLYLLSYFECYILLTICI